MPGSPTWPIGSRPVVRPFGTPGVIRLAPARPRGRLSWSGLRKWLDCPYRFLLEYGFALRRDEDVQREFGRREYGSKVHEVLQRFLAPGSDGYAALVAGDGETARRELDRAAVATFVPGALALEVGDQPDRALWLEAFRDLIDTVVEHELSRFIDWRPVGFETGFELPLDRLHGWLLREMERLSRETGIPLVATNDVHYIRQGHAEAHDILLCIQMATNVDDERRLSFPNDQFYL